MAQLCSILLVGGCAAVDPPLPERSVLAEAVGITIGACLPFSATSGAPTRSIFDIETELVLGGDVVTTRGLLLDRTALVCLYRAGADCIAARACLGIELRVEESCAAFPRSVCSLGHVVTCIEDGVNPPHRMALDCSVRGQFCVELDGLSLAVCADGTCVAREPQRVCDGAHVEACSAGARFFDTCRPGTTCSVESEGCIGTGAPCTTDVCDGDVLRICDPFEPASGGRHFGESIDCAAHGLTCRDLSGSVACVPDAPEACSPLDTATCRAGVLVHCGMDHQVREYDCLAHGYVGCARGICTPAEPAL